MVPIIISIEYIEDPALLVGFKDGSFRKLQPMVKNEDHPSNTILLPSARDPFIILTDFEKERVKVDTSILTISGVSFGGTFEDLQAEIGALVALVNAPGGAGNILADYGLTGDYTQTQTMKPGFVNSAALTVGRVFAIPVYLNGDYDEFSLIRRGSIHNGNFNFAIYEGDKAPGAPFFPKKRIWQSSEHTLTGAAVLVQDLISPAMNFKAGWYYFGYQATQGFIFTGSTNGLIFLGLSLAGTTLATIDRLNAVYAYTNEMPETWPATTFKSLAGTPPLLIQKKAL